MSARDVGRFLAFIGTGVLAGFVGVDHPIAWLAAAAMVVSTNRLFPSSEVVRLRAKLHALDHDDAP